MISGTGSMLVLVASMVLVGFAAALVSRACLWFLWKVFPSLRPEDN